MNQTEKLNLTKTKLTEAAEKLMRECREPNEVTSRAIAKEAGVQLAMINYCFGSREALLYQLFAQKSDEYLNEPRLKEILSADLSSKEKLRQMHYEIAEFLMNTYQFSKAITGYVLLHRDLTKGLNSLPLVMEHYYGRKSEQECRIISYELSSVMQLAIYRHEELQHFSGYDLTDRQQLRNFIDLQIDLFLKD